jgi:hypothetical protein
MRIGRLSALVCMAFLTMALTAPLPATAVSASAPALARGASAATACEPLTTGAAVAYEWRTLFRSNNATFDGLHLTQAGKPYGLWTIVNGGQNYQWWTLPFSSAAMDLDSFDLRTATDAKLEYTASWVRGSESNQIFIGAKDMVYLYDRDVSELTALSGSGVEYYTMLTEFAGMPSVQPFFRIKTFTLTGSVAPGHLLLKNIVFSAYLPALSPPPPPSAAVDTVLTLNAPASCAKAASITLTGTLKTSAGVPLAGKQVWIDAGTPIIGSEGGTWETLMNPLTTNALGAFSTTVQPIKSLYLRARFDAQTGYNGATSLLKTVTVVLPAAKVYTPHAPTSARHGKSYTVWGYLKPQHAAGSFAIKLYCYRLQKGKYVLRKTVSVSVSNYSTYSKYSGKVSLPYTGKWRIKAGHSDDDHRASYSGYDYVRSY